MNDNKRLLFIMNPNSGTRQTAKYLADIFQLYSDAGFLTTVMMTAKSGDARDFAAKYSGDADVTVVAGGDGTFNEVVSGIISSGSGCSIGYIPSGSTNDFATSVGLPKGIVNAARIPIVGKPRAYDMGDFNGRIFSYVASFGAFASTSYDVPQNIKNILGHSAYILSGIKDVFKIRDIEAEIVLDPGTSDEKNYSGKFILGMVCNSKRIGGVLSLDSFNIDMNDGLMEVLLIESPRNVIELNDIAANMLNGTLKHPRIKFLSARNVRFNLNSSIPWTLDGEYQPGASDVNIETIPSAIRLMV